MANGAEGGFYKLLLVGFPDERRFPAIRGLREIFDYTLVGAKRATEQVPYLLAAGLTFEEADRLADEMAQNEAITEILPDGESTVHNESFFEVTCPECGYVGLKILHEWDIAYLAALPDGMGKPTHRCQACHCRFTED